MTFHATGDITGSYGSRLTIGELNAEANEREGVVPLRSRRRTPRTLPAWVVQASLVTVDDRDDEPVRPARVTYRGFAFQPARSERPVVSDEQMQAWLDSINTTFMFTEPTVTPIEED
jgi:hypothetical protein